MYGYGLGVKGIVQDLLSNNICIVAGFDLEAAVVGPEIDGDAYARNAALIDLSSCQ